MRSLPLLPVLLLVSTVLGACGGDDDPAVRCDYGGRTYAPGESFALDCNTCACGSDGMVACTAIACVDAATPDAGGGDAGSADDAGLACASEDASTLAGVRIVFPDQPCIFTLAEAAAGIGIDYDLVVDADLADVTTRPQDAGGCGMPDPGGLILFEILNGPGQSFCLCDTGLCVGGGEVVSLTAGTYRSTFSWMGRNWMGPSDTGNPMGDPFPPGSYTLRVSARGESMSASYEVSGTFTVHVTP